MLSHFCYVFFKAVSNSRQGRLTGTDGSSVQPVNSGTKLEPKSVRFDRFMVSKLVWSWANSLVLGRAQRPASSAHEVTAQCPAAAFMNLGMREGWTAPMFQICYGWTARWRWDGQRYKSAMGNGGGNIGELAHWGLDASVFTQWKSWSRWKCEMQRERRQ